MEWATTRGRRFAGQIRTCCQLTLPADDDLHGGGGGAASTLGDGTHGHGCLGFAATWFGEGFGWVCEVRRAAMETEAEAFKLTRAALDRTGMESWWRENRKQTNFEFLSGSSV
jgi:hypothetical protein